MVTQRFGWETRRHLEDMNQHQLSRKLLLEEFGVATATTAAQKH